MIVYYTPPNPIPIIKAPILVFVFSGQGQECEGLTHVPFFWLLPETLSPSPPDVLMQHPKFEKF